MGIYEKPKGSNRWGISYKDENGQRHRIMVGPKARAQTAYTRAREKVRMARLFPEEARAERQAVTVAETIDRFLPQLERKKSYREDKRFSEDWKKRLGGRLLAEVRPEDIERYRTERLKVVKPATVNRAVAFLKMIFNLAIDSDLATANPVTKVKQLKENNTRVRYLVDGEEAQLRAVTSYQHFRMFEIAWLTGMRQMEQLRLRVTDLDIPQGLARVTDPKNKESRMVELNSRAVELFQEVLAENTSNSPWLFPGRKPGAHLTARGAQHILERACDASGITNLHWHDFRHDFCSKLAMAGVELLTIMELAGHKSLSQARRYSHLHPAYRKRAVEKLARKASKTLNKIPSRSLRRTEAGGTSGGTQSGGHEQPRENTGT